MEPGVTVTDERPPEDVAEEPPEPDDEWFRDYQASEEYRADWPHEDNDARTVAELKHLGAEVPLDVDHATALRIMAGNSRLERAAHAGYGDLDCFLHEHEPDHNWLVPGLLERGDRLILTGQEGKGKSTLLRQIAVQVASGIHPFNLEAIPAKRVLAIDLENGRRHVRREFRPLRLSAGEHLLPGFMVPVVWPAGIDLLQKEDRHRFTDLLAAVGADLLILGPSYKLAGGDPTSEEVARKVTQVLDELREEYDLGIILEAHQPYAASGSARRVERPYGASLWSRWPEFGLHLADGGELRHWRGDRDERDWPPALQRGGEWPWMAVYDDRSVTFARIVSVIEQEGEVSHRELARRFDCHHSHISRAIKANQQQYDAALQRWEETI